MDKWTNNLLIVVAAIVMNCNSLFGSVSDTLHVTHYTIYIDTINYTLKYIKGSCIVSIKSKMNNVNNISLSLLQLNIDSVIANGNPLSYSYNDTVISITPPVPLAVNDTLNIRIYYNGQPKKDPTGWGGFYFSGTYAFNLGAGFGSDPHVMGRIWFPCIDEFNDKSLYDFFITTPPAYKAFCNGLLNSQVTNPNGSKTWHWQMNQPIATYQAGMATSTFYTLLRSSNNLPVVWACSPSDTLNILNTFQHIDSILSSFITAYGPYPFDKVGFVLVPFGQGAMEHATSIHIGQTFVNGSLTYETLWAHELSHMWWGDKVTCMNEGDMWLNEGFASYNENFIIEKLYGSIAYKNRIRTNHRKVLQFAHITDGSYLSLTGVPHTYTYGSTVYDKGADVVHTLRNYMGDNNFFTGSKYYMTQRAYANATVNDLRDDLTTASGINMTRFFDDWIATPGFPHFSIDSVEYFPGGLDHYFVYVRQRSKGNNHIYKMPVEVNFTNGIQDTTITVVIDSATQMFHIAIYFMASMITLDRKEKISDAITDYEKWISNLGSSNFPETGVNLNVITTGVDSSLVRIEHNWVKPDGWKQSNPGIRLSDYHYWKIDGILKPGFTTQATFSYNGSNSTATGHIDNSLITTSEDSLVILYRSSVAEDWSVVNSFVKLPGSSTVDKVGSIRVDTIMKGEYLLGMKDPTVNVNEQNDSGVLLTAFPNPSSDSFNIKFFNAQKAKASLMIFDGNKRRLRENRSRNNTDNRQGKQKVFSQHFPIIYPLY